MTLLDTDLAAAFKPTGRAERWDEDDLALLLLLLAGDTTAALLLWNTLAPRPFRGLLNAVPIVNVRAEPGTPPPVWFDLFTQRYGLGNRGFITEAAIITALEAVRTAAEARASAALTALYGGGDVGLWQQQTAADLKTLALAVALFGAGGASQVSDAIRGSASESLEFPLTRLARFARQVERGVVTFAESARRAVMYPSSVITETYHGARRIAHIAVGFDQEQNILAAAEHCQPDPRRPKVPDCPSLTAKGWVGIGMLPAPGKRICVMNCRCRLSFRRSP